MSIDIANESGIAVDEVGLAAVARFTLDQMRIHPLAELSVLLVDERTMTELHERWMGEPGPTDVLAFPMDELRPPHLGGSRAGDPEPGDDPGLLGDVVRHRLVGKIVDAYERYDAQVQQLDRGDRGSRPARRKGS